MEDTDDETVVHTVDPARLCVFRYVTMTVRLESTRCGGYQSDRE